MPKQTYAGFWIRFLAVVIDTVIVAFLMSLIGYGLSYLPIVSFWKLFWITFTINFVLLSVLYEILTTWLYGGTVGKLLFGLRVTTTDSKSITLLTSVGRYFGKFVSAILLGAGFIMAGVTSRKQGLHDKMVDTLVIYNPRPLLKKRARIILTILAIVCAIVYIAWLMINMMSGIKWALASSNQPISAANASNDIFARCQDSLLHDSCVVFYVQTNAARIPVAETPDICGPLSSTKEGACLAAMAKVTKNESVCQSTSLRAQRLCERQYGLVESLEQSLALDTTNDMYPGQLSAEGAYVGKDDDDGNCDEQYTFPQGRNYYICFKPVHVTGFEQNVEGMSEVDMDLIIQDSKGVFVENSKNIWAKNGEQFFRYGELADWMWVRTELQSLRADSYNYTLIVYDDIGLKKVVLTGTFEVSNQTAVKRVHHALEVGKTDEYSLKGYSYEVTLRSASAEEAVFSVNGEVTPPLRKNDSFAVGGSTATLIVDDIEGTTVYFWLASHS